MKSIKYKKIKENRSTENCRKKTLGVVLLLYQHNFGPHQHIFQSLLPRFLKSVNMHYRSPPSSLKADIIKEWPLRPYLAFIVFKKVSCVNFYLENGHILYVFLSKIKTAYSCKKKSLPTPHEIFWTVTRTKEFFFLGLSLDFF